MRVVLDPNVIISAAIARGAPRQVFDHWLEGEAYELVVSAALVAEVAEVLSRPHIRRLVSPAEAIRLIEVLERLATSCEDPASVVAYTPDPDDDYLIALALAAEAEVIVSGDAHLAAYAGAGPRVLTPRDFLELLESQGDDRR